ncbi:GNAT family N-acetyltransferase [Roseomonas populi]|uniref:GNAT family N-acetyltransferase n=1 Tax=Roseomonas populi TaxID=3121582 RepID=A0ABT1XAH4_9PROT|nr:GNAT family N-acetyltransferase [Roseomonas pecuniae]MCR0984699.1 GNAT family N-acetyltransferase [Roseomonas pecuniae]
MPDVAFHIAPAASAGDLAEVARLFREYAEGLGVDLSFQGFEAELASLPGRYAPPAGALLLARGRDGTPMGCAALRPLGDGLCEMKRLFVPPRARGLGLGRALVEAVLAAARAARHREVRLDTLPGMAEAVALYRSVGFRPVPPYYETPVPGTIFLARAP